MDHSFPPHKDDSRSRSYQPRSSSGVPVSAIETTAPSLDFSGLDFFNAPRTAPLDFRYSSSASSREEAPSPSYTTAVPAPPRSATFINTPTHISQPYSPFAAVSALSPHFLERRWTDNDLSSESTSSFVQQQHHHNQHQLHHFHLDRTADRSPTLSSTAELPGTMSTLAVHYDPSFATMGSRPSFTWPAVLEPNGLGHDASLDHLSDAALTPASGSSRSITASPPRPSLTPEQRELKRQQDAVRRDTKNSMRIRRTSTHPYTHSPPMSSSVSDTMSMSMPVYSAAPPTVSLMAETPTGLPAAAPPPQQQQPQQQQQQYMQPYSPPLTEPSSAGTTVFTPTYAPPMQHGYGLSMDYPAYPAASSYDGRPVPAIYPMPGGMPPSAIHPDEAHVRVVQSRPKPQCWDHGCNGRQFSTFSNLLRHQREKSGQATKSVCPQCGQSFTRSTARNGHITQGKCRGRSSDMNDESDPQDESASLDASLKSDGGRSE